MYLMTQISSDIQKRLSVKNLSLMLLTKPFLDMFRAHTKCKVFIIRVSEYIENPVHFEKIFGQVFELDSKLGIELVRNCNEISRSSTKEI